METTGQIDLFKISRKYMEVEYDPERFPGLIMRINNPRSTFLIFSSGKMVITGLKNADEANPGVKKVINYLKKAGINVSNQEIKIQNIVASGDLHAFINLDLAVVKMENAMYDPEGFQGLIYRMKDPKTVFLIFSTGKVICTGANNEESVREAIIKLNKKLRKLDVLEKEN